VRPLWSLHGAEGGRHGGQGMVVCESGDARLAWVKEEEKAGWVERPNRPIGLTGSKTEEKFLLE
jgi:hypothetical protein